MACRSLFVVASRADGVVRHAIVPSRRRRRVDGVEARARVGERDRPSCRRGTRTGKMRAHAAPTKSPTEDRKTPQTKRRSREDLPADCILNGVDIAEAALQWRGELGYEEGAALHEGEFAAFVSYALANPTTFVALVDTYSVLDTGLRNFVTVALALAVRTRREIVRDEPRRDAIESTRAPER